MAGPSISQHGSEPSGLALFLSLPVIGGYLATLTALIPLFPLYWIRSAAGYDGDLGGIFWMMAAVVSAVWLLFLEGIARVRLTTPHIPIPLLWFTPFVFIAGVVALF